MFVGFGFSVCSCDLQVKDDELALPGKLRLAPAIELDVFGRFGWWDRLCCFCRAWSALPACGPLLRLQLGRAVHLKHKSRHEAGFCVFGCGDRI